MKKFFILIFITAFYYGCKKEEMDKNTAPNVANTAFHKIKEVTFSDGNRDKYSYNNNNRVDSIIFEAPGASYRTTVFSYASSTVKRCTFYTYTGVIADSIIFCLNAAGNPDSSMFYDVQNHHDKITKYYTFDANGFLSSITNDLIDPYGFYFQYQESNLIKISEVYPNDTNSTSFTYDTLVNNTNFELFPMIQYMDWFYIPSKNLVSSYSTEYGGDVRTYTVENLFNSNGYLTTTRVTDNNTLEQNNRYFSY